MKKFLLGFSIVSLLTGVIIGQSVNSSGSADTINKTAISKNGAGLESGTQISGQLQNSIDVKKAKVGDQVVLKTTQAIKQNGKTVVNKGSNIVGRVTEVQQKTKGQAMSKIGVVFDSLQNGKMMMPISATIVSLTQAQSSASLNDNSADIMGSSSTNTTTRTTGSNSAGLLGGVTNTVGSVVNTTTNTVGGVTNTVGQTVGNTTNTLGGTLKGIQISQSSDVSAQGSSTLSLQGGNLHLEKGTTFNLRLTEASSVNTGNR